MNLNELKKLSGINEAYGIRGLNPQDEYDQKFNKIKKLSNGDAMRIIWGWIHRENLSFDEFSKLVSDYWRYEPPANKSNNIEY